MLVCLYVFACVCMCMCSLVSIFFIIILNFLTLFSFLFIITLNHHRHLEGRRLFLLIGKTLLPHFFCLVCANFCSLSLKLGEFFCTLFRTRNSKGFLFVVVKIAGVTGSFAAWNKGCLDLLLENGNPVC